MRRRLLLIVGVVLAAGIVAVATLPFWLGAAAARVGRARGLTFADYERIGYARFALRDAEYRRGNVRVTVSRVEAPTPVLWLWRHWRGTENPIVAGRWEVEIVKSATPRPATSPRGWMPLRARLQRIATQLERWLPAARTGAGVVRFPAGEIAVEAAAWANRELAVTGLKYRAFAANATLAFPRGEDRLRLNARTTDGTTALALDSVGAAVEGELAWREQKARVSAQFAGQGWRPEQAELAATEWRVPGEALKLERHYANVRATARLEWRDGRIRAQATASGEPVEGRAAPPLALDLRGHGDPNAFTIEALSAEIPGVTARLTEPVTVARDGTLRESGARLTVDIDLAEQPWFAATGAVNGEANVVTVAGATTPVVEFSLAARDVTAKDIRLAAVEASGRLDWPTMQLTSGTLVGGEGERLALSGGWNFKTKEILAAKVDGEIRRSSIARLLPKQPAFEALTISAQASGSLAELRHEGRVQAKDVVFSGVNPLAIVASWNGRGLGAERFEAEVRAREGRIVAVGSVSREALRFTALEFTQAGEERLTLQAPATVRWRPELRIEALRLAGPQGQITASATLGSTGRIELAAANIASRWFTDFVPEKGPAWQLTLLALMGTWDRGPMNFSLTAGAAVEIGEGRTAAVNAAAQGDGGALRIEALRAIEGDATVVNASGRLPVTLYPFSDDMLRIDEQGPIVLDAMAAPHAAFWQKLATVSGVELKEPAATARVRGTWIRPEGSVSVQAARVTIDPEKVARPLPAIEAIDVRLTGDAAGVTLETFAFELEGQDVRARGRLPLGEGGWSELFKRPLEVARRGADLRLDIPEADVAVFARYLPAVLAPKGRLEASMTFSDGELGGFVRLRDAASRPLGPLGVLQEISADLELAGRTLELKNVTARSGGQPVTLSGTVALPEGGVQPRLDLALKGENLPFVRQTGLLLRGDLDLKLQTPESGPTRLTGVVRLRDSLFLADVRSFIPEGGASASRRPPYFSVDTPPMNAWVLAVEVTGEEFMRLRTPVFNGVASARFRLSGTLGTPRAIGEVEIDEGLVRMPFARFEVQQGSVRLTEAEPYEPTIYLRATGRRYGYDLTLEIDGKASAPNVVFTSSPALESEQVLLMVMTGATPTDEISVTGTQRVTRLGTYLGQSLLGSLLPGSGEADRLTITTGEKISREGHETYDVELKLTDDWALTVEKNEFDEVNAGVKWRIFSGEQPAKEKAPAADAANTEGGTNAK